MNYQEVWAFLCENAPTETPFKARNIASAYFVLQGYSAFTARDKASQAIDYFAAESEGGLVEVSKQFYRFYGPADEK